MDTVRDNLIFNLERWPEAGVQTEFALAPSTLTPFIEAPVDPEGDLAGGEPLTLLSDLTGGLDLRLYGRRLRVKGTFAVKVELVCHRCLAPIEGQISDKIDDVVELVKPGEEPKDRELAVDLVDNQFDLTPLLCEFVWLSFPMKVLCRPDCLGLCLTCGANLNEGLCSCESPQVVRH